MHPPSTGLGLCRTLRENPKCSWICLLHPHPMQTLLLTLMGCGALALLLSGCCHRWDCLGDSSKYFSASWVISVGDA